MLHVLVWVGHAQRAPAASVLAVAVAVAVAHGMALPSDSERRLRSREPVVPDDLRCDSVGRLLPLVSLAFLPELQLQQRRPVPPGASQLHVLGARALYALESRDAVLASGDPATWMFWP